MMDSYNPYSNHGDKNQYPIIHMNEMEECSSLDCTMDEEAITNVTTSSWWVDPVETNDGNDTAIGSTLGDKNVNPMRTRFSNLTRHVNNSSSRARCIFFISVFVVLSSIGLAGVGVGLMFKNADGFGFSYKYQGEVDSAASVANSMEQQQQQQQHIERNSDDDFTDQVTKRNTPGTAPLQTSPPTYIFSTPYPSSTSSKGKVWATEPTATTAVIAESEEFGLISVSDNLELSMSIDLNEDLDDMSMLFEDFEQFDFDFDSMSMSSNVVIDEEPTEIVILGETTVEPSTGIVMDDIDIDLAVSETDSTEIAEIATDTTTPAVATKPFIDRANCIQSKCSVELSDMLTMDYQVIIPEATTVEECDGCTMQVKMTFDGIAWLGFGFSNDGGMIGSEAIIGVPVKGDKQTPQKYNLGGQSIETVQPMPVERQALQDASIRIGRTNNGIKTVMKFTKLLDEANEIQIGMGNNTFLWAHGLDENLAYHAGRGAISMDLISGEIVDIPGPPSTPMATDPTELVTDSIVMIDEASVILEPSVVLVTEPAVASTFATEGTMATEAIGPTTLESNTPFEGTATPTYYPTVSPELITEVLKPIADTFVEFNSTKIFGPRKWLKVDGEPERITLIRFDLSSLASNKAVQLISAKLRMYALTSSPFGGRIDIIDQDICGEWDEKELTWSNSPPGVFVTPPENLGSFGAVQEFSSIEADLTLDLQFLPMDFTMKITSNRGNGVTYASKENVTAAPELVLEYMGTLSEESDMPTSAPTEKELITDSPTESPITASPTMSPIEPLVITARRDAMLRNGKYSDRRFGSDDSIAMKSHENPNYTGKSIIQFDVSDLSPDVEYSYELKLFITYTGDDDERTLSIYSITEAFSWGEDWITWNRLGEPDMTLVGSNVVRQRDVDSYVSFSLSQLAAVDGRVNLVIEITSGPSDGSKVDYKTREAGSNRPVLIASV